MIDKLVKSIAKGAGEVVAAPLTAANAAAKAVTREIDKATGGKEKK